MSTAMQWQMMPPGAVTLEDREVLHRIRLNRDYMLSLQEDALMQNFLFEAGLRTDAHIDPSLHGGWESPTCQLRGHFLGHYLSACARAWRNYGDAALRGRGESIVHRLRLCQKEHGDGWVFSIPETYLKWLENKKRIWAPQYTLHKTLMGLNDMARHADCAEALEVLKCAADWFYDWSGRFTREQFDDMLDVETGGMMEAWADLYAMTGDEKHLTLMRRYERPRLYSLLLDGKDALTHMHANTTIPEIHGVMRAYEVTGEKRYLDIVQAYWRCAVEDRGYFATGGQTCDEAWTPCHQQAEFLGPDNQEHCTVYNLILLADFLLRCTGDVRYADYAERNFVNGILAQQHPESGMVAYYLPMHAGSKVHWGTPTQDFWCCHGSLVQAHARHGEDFCFETQDTLCIARYRAMRMKHSGTGAEVSLRMTGHAYYALKDAPRTNPPREDNWSVTVTPCDKPVNLQLRMPWWVSAPAKILDAQGNEIMTSAGGEWVTIPNAQGVYTIAFPYAFKCVPLDDQEDTVAFMEGPDVLIGETTKNTLMFDGEALDAHRLLRRITRSPYERRMDVFEMQGQGEAIRFIPLRTLADETYTLYFRVQRP